MAASAAPPSIRRATPADRAALGKLAGDLVRFHHALDPARFMLGDRVDEGYGRWLAGEADNPDALVLVATVESAIVGYVYARREPRNWNDLIDEHGKIHDVFVAPEGRRRGTARALLEAVCAELEALGCPRIVLATAATNEPAQRLFAAFGFRPTMLEMTRERGAPPQ